VEKNYAVSVDGFSLRSFYYAFAAYNTPESMEKFMLGPFSQEKLVAEFNDLRHFFYLAVDGEGLLGYVKLIETSLPGRSPGSDSIEISRIYVDNKITGRGVGQVLMNTAIRFARERKKTVIWLGVWEHNLRAIAFYKRFGFEKFGQHEFILGNDIQNDWLMKKDLL
jgi:ribosomal protein S18 acetylase RimI-like enzyme